MAIQAHGLERRLLGIEVVIEARLPHAEEVGDVLRRGAMVAALREDLGGGVDDFGKSLPCAGRRARQCQCLHQPPPLSSAPIL